MYSAGATAYRNAAQDYVSCTATYLLGLLCTATYLLGLLCTATYLLGLLCTATLPIGLGLRLAATQCGTNLLCTPQHVSFYNTTQIAINRATAYRDSVLPLHAKDREKERRVYSLPHIRENG